MELHLSLKVSKKSRVYFLSAGPPPKDGLGKGSLGVLMLSATVSQSESADKVDSDFFCSVTEKEASRYI
eukprot:scaffold78374_cov42-Prasinocladus_malaysianus.AAC.2